MVILGALLKAIGRIAIGCVIEAIVLRFAARWVVKMPVTFWQAYGTVFVASLMNSIIVFVFLFPFLLPVQHTSSVDGAKVVMAIMPLMLPIVFVAQSGVISDFLRIPFKKACYVTLVMIAINAGILLVAGGLWFLATRFSS